MRVSLKISLTVATILIVIISIMTVWQVRETDRLIEGHFGIILREIARLGSHTLSGEAHQRINLKLKNTTERKTIFNNPDFIALRAELKKIIKDTDIPSHCVYTLVPGQENALNTEFGINLYNDDENIFGNKYTIIPQNHAMFLICINEKKAVATGLYRDEHGQWISAYAPIIDSENKVVAVLEIDFDIHTFLENANKATFRHLITLGIVSVISLLAAFLVGHLLTRRIKRLQLAVKQVGAGNLKINLRGKKSKDEIADLEAEFEHMLARLRERLHMIKFIPSFALKKIEEANDGEINMDGERKKVVIFFADIRGFTKYSEDKDPKKIVALLNEAFCMETEIIQRHGGSVDKYIGDEVMAVFEKEDGTDQALMAADEIHRCIDEYADRLPIGIGIGIHIGEVIMGAVGHNERLDFTVIGSSVNLASRLCSQAATGETIVSTEFYQALSKAPELVPDRTAIKGYTTELDIYRIK
jgi:class 3 adenylate cyclase